MNREKIIVYQIFTRVFGNRNQTNKSNGSLAENGSTKLNDIDEKVLRQIKEMGVTHVWYTGIIRHATTTDYSAYGIPQQNPEVVKGKAGSPYAITDYYDVDPDLAEDPQERMAEFEALIERTHKAGMKVVLDFVPNHVARQYQSICAPAGVKGLGEDDDVNMHFSTHNNFYYCWGQPLDLSDVLPSNIPEHGSPTRSLSPKGSGKDSLSPEEDVYTEVPAKATGNDQFSCRPNRNDWYETVKLNYGIDYCDAGGRSEHFDPIPDTWNKMTDILLFWAAKGIDAFRCDMAEMVPAAFWAWATDKVKFLYPDKAFIGEVYDPAQYRNYIAAGFDYLYDKVGMYDCMRDVICGRRPASDITQQWQATDDIRDHMLYFLENHDEQRVASDFFAGDGRRGLPGHLVSVLLKRNPYMLYAGQEFGERGMECEGFSGKDGRTTIFDYWSVGSTWRGYFERRKLKKEERALSSDYQKILQMANGEKAVREGETFDLMYVNPQLADKQYAFLRKAGEELLIIVANFADNAAEIELVIPQHAFDFLQIPKQEVTAIDLLDGSDLKIILRPEQPIPMVVPPLGGRVYKVVLF